MPRIAGPIPPITPVPRELTPDDVRIIIEIAERVQTRRDELTAKLRAALDANDTGRVLEIAREICGLEKQAREQ
jgi:hypothetical protein